jgi:hypothetical protein
MDPSRIFGWTLLGENKDFSPTKHHPSDDESMQATYRAGSSLTPELQKRSTSARYKSREIVASGSTPTSDLCRPIRDENPFFVRCSRTVDCPSSMPKWLSKKRVLSRRLRLCFLHFDAKPRSNENQYPLVVSAFGWPKLLDVDTGTSRSSTHAR